MATKLQPLALLLAASLLLMSCSVERKLAHKFLHNQEYISVLVFPLDYLYKTNLKAYEVPDAASMDQYTLDSILFQKSMFVQYISDSMFLEEYVNALIRELRARRMAVYLAPDSDLFFDNQGYKYVVNLAQAQLEEDIEAVYEKDVDFQYYYLGDLYLNVVRFNAWFEISGVNEEAPHKEVAFSNVTLMDKLEGRLRFFPYTGEFKYIYTIDTIEVNQAYPLARLAGQRFAGYLADYMMNRYINSNLSSPGIESMYLRYDASARKIKPAGDKRFIIMK
ncbi:MAG: hypothetical protein U1C46_05180 [Bacteroidales bacterium]|nr:hypothetical protein [Bacteroidales bacterium]MDZ4204192.1 hypothetical protein [Bacteroidales bacterium]